MEEEQIVQRPSMIQRMERMRRNRSILEINTSRDLTKIKQQLVNLKEAADLVIAEIDELSKSEETTKE